jgi:ERCC4-related helicase
MIRPLKVIVFSQFRAALNVIGDRLLRKFGTACVAEFFGSHRKRELHKFTYEENCFCLLLTKDGSEGLDLSFVTNVIFLEEIFDKSLTDQVVARAWRMGASGQVHVETLIAKNTIEEVMGEHKHSASSEYHISSRNGDQQRLKSLLQSLRFIIDHQSPFHNNSLDIKKNIDIQTTDKVSLKRPSPTTNFDEHQRKVSRKERRTVRFAESG